MKKITLFLAIAILPMTHYSYCQTALEGKVTQADTGEPVIFGTVAVFQDSVLVTGTDTDIDGNYFIYNLSPGVYDIEASYVGLTTTRITDIIVKANKTNRLDIVMSVSNNLLEQVVVTQYCAKLIDSDNTTSGAIVTSESIKSLPIKGINNIVGTAAGYATESQITIRGSRSDPTIYCVDGVRVRNPSYEDQETYATFKENTFANPVDEALSTLSIDVDRAAYSNVRRFLEQGQMPPVDAVRIEEMVNYFDYKYSEPESDHPFDTYAQLVDCPWNIGHQLLHVSLQAKRLKTDELPNSNLVFLIDVSGSMSSANKLPLVISSFKLLLDQLRPTDRVAIVTYAGSAGVALESTPASEKDKIIHALNLLQSGGSTAGAEGILTAYQIAKENFIKGGNNRVILATDGDFNVGVSDNDSLEKLIEKERKSGVFFSILGYGMGNYKDDKMQILAQKGNGNHAYIDNMKEAYKVLVTEFSGTVFTVAKDVKIQIEFNPAYVQAYRLIGYESRLLAKEDFNNDMKDAGEMGAGHAVTAIYEIIPVGANSQYVGQVDELQYQNLKKSGQGIQNGELAILKTRYKLPDEDQSTKRDIKISVKATPIDNVNEEIKFGLGVALFGQILRQSDYLQGKPYDLIMTLCNDASTRDGDGDKSEFMKLVKLAKAMDVETMVVR
ncbi:MAG: von Willebrand factor type A domain-containing protein [Lewinellaceae bacterium]|nr:von Willebrand factor type A domain-containing protein [Lewinellaceae bacterium]